MHDNVTPLPTPPAKPVEKTRTITLTGRAPIQIKESDWPLVAEGWSGWDDSSGAPFSFNVRFKVREGKHGQTIIYGTFDYWEEDSPSTSQTIRVGRHVTVAYEHDLWKHLREVGEEMRERVLNGKLKPHVTLSLDACFAKLKPQTY